MISVGGLCEGYGGIFEALRTLTPVRHAWLADIDPDATRVLSHHYPGVPNLGDITVVDFSTIDRVDVLTSGFPCQPMSAAGRRLGADDPRHLWPTGVFPAVAALRPPLVVLENVRGLLTADGGRIFGQVLADLDGLGYAVSWSVVGACRVGACHHRHRVFIVATSAMVRVPVLDIVACRGRQGWEPAQGVLFGDPGAVPGWPAAGFVSGGRVWSMAADICGGGGASLPTPIARDSIRGAGWGDRPGRPLSEVAALLPTVRTSDTNGSGRHGDGGLDLRTAVSMLPSDVALPAAVQPEKFGAYAAAVARHERAYGLVAPDPTEPGRNGNPRLSAAFCEFMQGLPSGWLTDVVDSRAAIRMAGNGVNPRQCAFAVSSSPVFRCWLEGTATPPQRMLRGR